MAQPRFTVPSSVREELAEHQERMLDLALMLGDERTADCMRRRLDAIANGRSVPSLHGWEVGAPPNSGPWTLTADDQLILEEEAMT